MGRDRGSTLGSKTDSLAFAIALQVDALRPPRRCQILPSTLARLCHPQHGPRAKHRLMELGLCPGLAFQLLDFYCLDD